MTKDTRIDIDSGLTGLDSQAWCEQLEDVAEDLGYYNFLGKFHATAFIDAGPKLLVTFENAKTIIERNDDAEPIGFRYVRHEGWSHLGVYSCGESWFRDKFIYAYFDRLIDDGFFEDFEDVLFYGADAGAYAAAAYSVAAPGCRVLALRPQATLDPQITGFDTRYRKFRRMDFNSRYGYAPEMIDAVDRAYVAFDPYRSLDAMHAALFTKRNMTPLRCNRLGEHIEVAFDALEIAEPVMRGAMDGTLNELNFAKLMRARRDYPNYLRNLYMNLIRQERQVMAANVCAHAVRTGHLNFFGDRLSELQEAGFEPFRPVAIKAAE